MTKNEILNAIKKLGLEFEEPFMIDYGNEKNNGLWYDRLFKFTEENLVMIDVGKLDVDSADKYVEDLESGKSKVVKFWKPKDGETYYVPSLSAIEGYKSYIWSDDDNFGLSYLWQGVVCRTINEAAYLSMQLSNAARKLFIYNKREKDKAKDVDRYDYLNLFD